MKKLVITLDDFGFLRSVNNGIFYALSKIKIPVELSLMVWGKDIDYAIEQLVKYPNVYVGLHLEILGWQQLGRPATTKDYLELLRTKDTQQIVKLVKKELDRFEKLMGKKPSHITAHKGIHGNYKVLAFLLDYCSKNNIPMRRGNVALNTDLEAENYAANIMIKRSGIKMPDHLIAQISGNMLSKVKKKLLRVLKQVKEDENAELLLHPGFVNKELILASSLNYLRARDLQLLLDENFISSIRELGFTFVNFKDL